MADTETIGLIINVQSQNAAALEKISGQLSNIGKSSEKAAGSASKGVTAFQTLGKSFVFLNQGLEASKKAFRLFEQTVVSSIAKALDFRDATDPGKRAITEFGREVEVTQARLGDMFVPLLVGVAKAVTPILKAFQNWISLNRELIQSDIIKWVATLSLALTSTLGAAVNVVSGIWLGLKLTVIGVLMDIAKGLEIITAPLDLLPDSFQAALGPLANMSATFGDFFEHQKKEAGQAIQDWKDQNKAVEGLNLAVADVIGTAEHLAGSFKDASQKGRKTSAERAAAFAKEKKELEELDKIFQESAKRAANANAEHDKEVATAREKFRAAESAALEASYAYQVQLDREKNAAIEQGLDQQKEALDEFLSDTENSARDRAAAIVQAMDALKNVDLPNDKIEERQKELKKLLRSTNKEIARETAESYRKVGSIISSTLGDALSNVIDGTFNAVDILKGLAKSVIKLLVDIAAQSIVSSLIQQSANEAVAEAAVTSNARTAASAAFAANIGIPFIGPIVAAAAAVAAFAAASAFAAGGLVEGGTPGKDSVPAMLTPGEYVLPTHVVESIRAGRPPSKQAHYSSGGMVSARGGSGGSSGGSPVQQNFMMFTSSRAQFNKVYRDNFIPATQRLKRNRVIKAG